MSGSSQMQQQRPKIDRPSSASSNSSSFPSAEKNLMPGGQHMRPPPGTSSRDPHFNKSRPHSISGSSAQQQQQQSSSMKDRHSTGNGQQPSVGQHMKHEGSGNSKMMKIHPASIGVGSNQIDPTIRKQQQPYSGQGHTKLPPGYNQNSLQKHKNIGMKQQQNHSKHHQTSSQPPNQPPPPHSLPPQMPPPSQSFKLLDESVITDTTLKASPTHSQQSNKPTSIFSPDWKDSNSSMPPMPTLTQNLSNQQHQQRFSAQTNRNNNNSQQNLFSSKSLDNKKQPPPSHQHLASSQPPPLIGIGMSNDMDFIKQEKLSNEPPQQLLATKDINRETIKSSHQIQSSKQQQQQLEMNKSIKRPPSSLEEDRDYKMRKLEARMEGNDAIPELTAIKQEDIKGSIENKWPQQQQQPHYQLTKRPDELMRQQQMTNEQMKRESDKWSKGRGMRDMFHGMQGGLHQPVPPIGSYNDTQSIMYHQQQQQQNLGIALTQTSNPHQTGVSPSSMMMPPLNDNTKPKPLSSVNGIETNPDVIRNLLKESLVDTKFGPSLASSTHATILPISDTPGPLLSDNASDYSNITTVMGQDNQGMTTPATADNIEGGHHRKSEKKKKKEKHKHKEKSKDKDKDREERKKHKKDKDRHRDKSRDRDHSSSHHIQHQLSLQQLQQQQQNLSSSHPTLNQDTSMKITIPKTKISLSMTGEDLSSANTLNVTANIAATQPPSSGGLKIKIPKDRIKASTGALMPGTAPNDQAGIKIKISRNAIEGYNSNNK